MAIEMQLKLKTGNSGPLNWFPSKLRSADPENSADISLLLFASKTGSASLLLQQETEETVGRTGEKMRNIDKSKSKTAFDTFGLLAKYLGEKKFRV